MQVAVKSSIVLKAGTTAGLIKLITILVITISLIWLPAPANAGLLKPLGTVLGKRIEVIWTSVKGPSFATRRFVKNGSIRAILEPDKALPLHWSYEGRLQLARTELSEGKGPVQLDPIVGPEVRRKKNTYSLLDDELERTIHSESSSSSWTMQMAKSPEDILLQKQRKALFDRCIERVLSKSLFETFSLKYDENLSYKSISSQLGIRAGTVASRLSEARGKVRSRCGGIL